MKLQPQKVSAKRKKAASPGQPVLERVLGLSSKSSNGISSNPLTGDIAYTAAGVIVVYNPASNKQLARLINANCRTFACVTFSPDGKLLAAGEGACKGPKVLIWDYTPGNITLVKTLEGHRFGIDRLLFSPSGDLIVTVGVEHDQGLFLWNWRQSQRLTANKLSKKVNSLAFAPDGAFFVTCGQKSILFWLFGEMGEPVVTPASGQATVKCMACKGAALGEMRDKTFTSIATNSTNVFAITEDGKLCIFSREREMEKWMDLQVQGGAAIQVRDRFIYCGCTDGLIRCFDAGSLEHLVTLPRPPPLGAANITTDKAKQPPQASTLFADTTALDLIGTTCLLALYSDRTVFIWDLKRMDNIVASRALLNHSGAVNDLKVLPSSTMEMTLFATASEDKSIRIWYILHGKAEGPPVRNVFSKDLSRIIYTSKTFDHLKLRKVDDTGEGTVKCIAISQDAKLVASGDVAGTVRVHDLSSYREVKSWVAHDNDIISVDFTGKSPIEGRSTLPSERFLASCSRDRIIHITKGSGFEYVTSLEDHTSSINDMKFVRVGDMERLVSCSADKIMLFRNVKVERGEVRVETYQKAVQRQRKFHCLEVHPFHKELISGEDKLLTIWDLETGKPMDSREITDPDVSSRPDSYTKIALDTSGLLLAAASSDKFISLFDYLTGTLQAKMNVGEKVNALAFTYGGEKLLTATSDGCVFVWALPKELTGAIRKRLLNMRGSKPEPLAVLEDIDPPFRQVEKEEGKEVQIEPPKRLHDSQLPDWAKHSVFPEGKSDVPVSKEEGVIPGKWGKNASIEFGFEEVESVPEPSEPVAMHLRKVDIIRAVEEVESEDEKTEELESKPIVEVMPPPSTQQNFNVTRSAVGIPKREEEPSITDAYDGNPEEEIIEELESQPKAVIRDPMRKSFTSTLMLKKIHDPSKPDSPPEDQQKPLYFDLEPVPVSESDIHVPKIGEFKKRKQDNITEALAQISDVRHQLEPLLRKDSEKAKEKKKLWGRPESDFQEDEGGEEPMGKFNKSAKKIPMGKIIAEQGGNPFSEAGNPPKPDSDDTKSTPSSGKSYDSRPQTSEEAIRPRLGTPAVEEKKADARFNTPSAVSESSSISIPESLGSITSSQFFASAKTQGNRQMYVQSFKELRQSLQSVNAFFSQVDTNDAEYSTSLEESSREVEEIHQLIAAISRKLGRPVEERERETALLERFSEQLVSRVLEKLDRK